MQISWKLMQKTRGDWGRPGVTVIWVSPGFGHPHFQNPSDTGIPCNPNPVLGWGCRHCLLPRSHSSCFLLTLFREVSTIWGPEQAKPELTCNLFSSGQRLALLEEKLVLAHVLRHFKIQSTQSYDELQLCSELILRPKEGVFVTLTDRQ